MLSENMPSEKDLAIDAIQDSFGEAIKKVSAEYGECLIEANGDPARESECRDNRDRGLAFAKRAHSEMLQALNRQWPDAT